MKKIISFLAMFLLVNSLIYGAGLGVAPAVLKFENALKGATTVKEIIIQNPGDKDITASIQVSGELQEWIELSSNQAIVPAKGEIKVSVKLTPPVDASNKEYASKFVVRAQGSSDVDGSGMGLLPGIDTDIIATVTDQEIIDGEISKILTKDEDYGKPIVFTIGFTNDGNVPAGPEVKIIISKGSEQVDVIEKTLDKINPGESKDYVVEWHTNGKEKNVYYRANVVVFLNNKIIETKENVGFRILEPVKNVQSATNVEKNATNFLVGLVLVIVIVIVGLIIFYLITKKNKK